MAFTIDQIINLSKTGFSADQIKAFENSLYIQTPTQVQQVQQVPVQQVQQVPVQQVQQVPVQQVQQVPVQQVQQVQQVPQVQQAPVQQVPVQQVPVQQVQQVPVQQIPQSEPVYSETANMQMFNILKAMQEQNLAQATGKAYTPPTAEDVGLSVLGKGDNK